MTTAEFEHKYNAYIKSAQWRNIRAMLIKDASNQCSKCKALGYSSRPLEIHHKTYERLGRESLNDLEVLCKSCHEQADLVRAAEGKARSEKAVSDTIYQNGRNTYMTKKYGEGWLDDGHDIEEFDEWLDKKQEQERYYCED